MAAIKAGMGNYYRQDDLLRQMVAALGARKLAIGIRKVWKEAMEKRGVCIEERRRCAVRR